MAYNIIPQRGVFSTIVNLINENFQRIYQQILGLGGSGEQAAENISQLESDVSALQSGKANDADVVHKAGAETITGNKTFTGTVKLPLQNSGILVTDENGVVQSDSIVIVNDVTYEAGDNIFYLKKTVNGSKSNIVQVEVTPNSNSTGLVTSGGIYTALAHKVDKIPSSTDNAVVRFDGTSGNIQNSGVTINDSNHLTAAKLITSGGTSSQFVKGDGSLDNTSYVSSTDAIKNGDYLVSNYTTSTNSIKGRVFDRNSQDTFFAANSRFIVTHKRYNSTDDSFINNLSTDLFKGTFNSYGNTVLDGEYGILYMGNVAEDELSATTSNTNCVFVYPQGKIFLTFYTSMRCGEILEAKGWFRNDTTWRNLTVVANNTIVYEIQVPSISYLKAIRIKYSGSNLGSEKKTSLSDVAYIRNRDDIVSRNIITKYPTAQRMYGNLTAPKFITSGGTSSQFVKGDGTLDSTSYAPLASPALTGTPTAPTAAAGTNTTQIATTAFVKSAVEDLSDSLAKGIKTISVLYGDATSIVLETEKINGNEGTVSIPAATSQAAGAMSAAQAALLEDLSNLADDIETLLASI